MTDVYLVAVAVVSAILAVAIKVAIDREYARGFRDGIQSERMINRISWEIAMDAIEEDDRD